MAVDPWAIDASSGSPAYSGQELRLGTITALTAGVGTSLGVRTGVRHSGSGTDLLVQAQSTPNMTVKVNPGVVIVQGGISATQGAYSWTLDATTNLTIAASHATLDRTDLVAVRIRDASVDTSGARDGNVVVITGTNGGGVPALPTDATYLTIAQVSVVHAVTTITSGAITDKRVYTTALGGVLLCDSTSEPAAASVAPDQITYRTDLGLFRYVSGGAYRMLSPYRASNTLSGTAASVTFSSIPSTLRRLTVYWTARCDNAVQVQFMELRVNADSGANYNWENGQANNATASAGSSAAQTFGNIGLVLGSSAPANVFASGDIVLPGWDAPHSTNLGWQFRSQSMGNGVANYYAVWGGGVYTGAGPYTSITLRPEAGNFVAGSEFIIEGWD